MKTPRTISLVVIKMMNLVKTEWTASAQSEVMSGLTTITVVTTVVTLVQVVKKVVMRIGSTHPRTV